MKGRAVNLPDFFMRSGFLVYQDEFGRHWSVAHTDENYRICKGAQPILRRALLHIEGRAESVTYRSIKEKCGDGRVFG